MPRYHKNKLKTLKEIAAVGFPIGGKVAVERFSITVMLQY
jgi:Na+-driven multidrug efflux pump